MKKSILLIGLLTAMALLNLSAQESIWGEYSINAECHISEMWGMEDCVEIHKYDIDLKKSNEVDSDMEFFMPKHGIDSYIKCQTTNDNKFDIINKKIDKGYGYSVSISGNGQIVGDSIFMHYVTASSIAEGVLNCDCKGISKTKTSLKTIPTQFVIYINDQFFIVKAESDRRQNIRIYDVSGRMVCSSAFVRNTAIDKSGFDSGVYIVNISDADGSHSQNVKIVI